MDEPSAPLTSAEVASMFEVVERLRKEGVSIIYISHRLEEIYRLSDRILVMRDGEYVKTLITKDSEVQELIKLMVGRELTQSYPPRKDCVKKDEVVLELQNVTGNGDTDISLKIHKGEILGLGGLVGAGRTELAEMIFGAVRKKSGKMILGIRGEDIKFDSLNMELRKDDILKATVSNVEVMGNENNIYFTLGGETIIARASKYDLKSIGEEIEFVIDSNRLHFFDIETEESILNYLNESETAI